MSRRTTEAYKSVFDYIHKNILPLNAKGIITDFEQAERNALAHTVPNTPLVGCWFHHCQSLRKKVASIPDLFARIRNDKKAAELYRHFQCLALLPPGKIKPAFDTTAFEALQEYPEFGEFITYYDKQWIQRVTPEGYSVFLQVICVEINNVCKFSLKNIIFVIEKYHYLFLVVHDNKTIPDFLFFQDTRTTGAAEATNGKMGKTFKTHGNIFNFMATFQREEVVKSDELERDVDGLIQPDKRKKKYKDRSMIIEQYSQLLKNENISVARFLKTMVNMDNKITFLEHEYPILELEDIDFKTVEDLTRFKEILKQNPGATDEIPVVVMRIKQRGKHYQHKSKGKTKTEPDIRARTDKI